MLTTKGSEKCLHFALPAQDREGAGQDAHGPGRRDAVGASALPWLTSQGSGWVRGSGAHAHDALLVP